MPTGPITVVTGAGSTRKLQVVGAEKESSGRLNLGTYATGGVPFTAKGTFGLSSIRKLAMDGVALLGALPRLVYVDWTNQKIMLFVPDTHLEVADQTDVSGMVIGFSARGTP